MAELHARKQEELADCYVPFDDDGNYQKAIRFGDKALVDALEGYNARIRERDEKARMTEIYDDARRRYEAAQTQKACLHAASLFESIASFRDATQLAAACREKAEVCRKDEIYNAAKVKMHGTRIESYEAAIRDFETIPGWKDADEQIDLCREKIEALKEAEKERKIADELAEEKRRKIIKKAMIITPVALCVCIIVAVLINFVIIPSVKYHAAISLKNEGNYNEAISAFEAMNGYRDSVEQILSCRYDSALALADKGNYAEASTVLKALNQDSEQKAFELKTELLRTAEVGDTIYFGNYEQGDDSDGREPIAWRVLAKEDNRILVISNNVIDRISYPSFYTWLNHTFFKEAFSADEQKIIVKIFLFDADEANQYFNSDEARSCGEEWWLETTRGNLSYTVNDHGVIQLSSHGRGFYSYAGVRPAMWIDISNL